MKKSFGDYRLLAKGNRRVGSLWEGPEHLLYIETSGFMAGFTESYRRIDYKNIQAISIARTRRGIVLTIFMLLLLAFLGWGITANLQSFTGGAVFFGIIAAIILTALIVHLARGPTCICKVQTAVQFLHLKPIDRTRKAERFVQRMSELCTAHQGGQELNPSAMPAGAVQSANRDIKQPWTGSKLVNWVMVLLILSGAVMIADIFIKDMLFFTIDALLGIAAYSLAVAAVARTMRYELPAALKISLWGTMVNFVLCIITGYGLVMYANLQLLRNVMAKPVNGFGSGTNERLYRYISDAGFEELGWAAWVIIALGAAAIFFGLLGLPSALRPGAKASISIPPPMPAAAPSAADPLP